MRLTLLACVILFAASLAAQSVDTVGGTAYAPTRSGLAKANIFGVDKTVLLHTMEMYLNIPGTENLTWFLYRHHSQKGTYQLEWTLPVQVAGTGLGWYSPGLINLPLVQGNHYMLGVSWVGSVTYHYSTATSGQPVSFGYWYSARTPTGLPTTLTIGGVDSAQYYQRLTTTPLPNVQYVGVPCISATSPRLLMGAYPILGAKLPVYLAEAPASQSSVYLLGRGPTMPTPLPILGCDFWLPPSANLISIVIPVDSTGTGLLNVPVPNDPALKGYPLSWQAVVQYPPAVSFSNAVQITF